MGQDLPRTGSSSSCRLGLTAGTSWVSGRCSLTWAPLPACGCARSCRRPAHCPECSWDPTLCPPWWVLEADALLWPLWGPGNPGEEVEGPLPQVPSLQEPDLTAACLAPRPGPSHWTLCPLHTTWETGQIWERARPPTPARGGGATVLDLSGEVTRVWTPQRPGLPAEGCTISLQVNHPRLPEAPELWTDSCSLPTDWLVWKLPSGWGALTVSPRGSPSRLPTPPAKSVPL